MKHVDLRLIACGALVAASAFAQNTYQQVNLVSDVPNLAGRRDFQLVNAWGITFAEPSGPWWVNAAGTGLSILYDGAGAPAGNGLKVTIPPIGQSIPTGIVFNNTPDFFIAPGQRANFHLFEHRRDDIRVEPSRESKYRRRQGDHARSGLHRADHRHTRQRPEHPVRGQFRARHRNL